MAGGIDEVRYGTLDRGYAAALAALAAEDDGPFFMLNLMRYREWADYPDGAGVGPRISGRAADDRYAPLEILGDLGAEVVLFGDAVAQPRGDEAWDRVAIVRYPTVRSFIEMQARPDFLALHVHKDAGMDLTVLAVCQPVSGTSTPGRRVLVDLVGGVDHDSVDEVPGRLVFRVDGTPVGDGRGWSTLAVTTIPDDATAGPLLDAAQGTTVAVEAYLKELP